MLCKLKWNLYYNLNPHLMIGKESITTALPSTTYYQNYIIQNSLGGTKTTTDNIFLGFQLDNGIYYLQKPFYIGLDFVFRTSNISIIDSDLAAKLNVGFTF